VTAIAGNPPSTLPARRWRDPAAWLTTVDVCAILVALSLPWSTSLVAIFGAALLITRIPFLDVRSFLQLLRQPICMAPIALFLLACVGTLWSDASWATRLHAINPTVKLLMLPVLFYHFQRSERGVWVLVAFLISCSLLAAMSWIVLFHPELSFRQIDPEPGIFVKSHIQQGQEFTLCAVALAFPIIGSLRARNFAMVALLVAVVLNLLVNMAFVTVSRTALVTMPIMLAVFGLLHLQRRTNLMIFAGLIMAAIATWAVSPHLQDRISSFARDYRIYKEDNQPSSIGSRLEFWEKSLRFFVEAPIIGHGSGSTRGLFEQAATAPAVLAGGQVVSNPHNQTLNVAVQWGALGIAVLFALWAVHLRLFRGETLASWIGLLVVVQNIFTSLFNSHLFDFHEGWMYVLGVGVAGGMVLRAQATEPAQVRIPNPVPGPVTSPSGP
jgi:O-antigen ligase